MNLNRIVGIGVIICGVIATGGIISGTTGCAALAAAGPLIGEIASDVADAQMVFNLLEPVVQSWLTKNGTAPDTAAIQKDMMTAQFALQAFNNAFNGTHDLTDGNTAAALLAFQQAYGDLQVVLEKNNIVLFAPTVSPAQTVNARSGVPVMPRVKLLDVKTL